LAEEIKDIGDLTGESQTKFQGFPWTLVMLSQHSGCLKIFKLQCDSSSQHCCFVEVTEQMVQLTAYYLSSLQVPVPGTLPFGECTCWALLLLGYGNDRTDMLENLAG